jgi:hypothetical protein
MINNSIYNYHHSKDNNVGHYEYKTSTKKILAMFKQNLLKNKIWGSFLIGDAK